MTTNLQPVYPETFDVSKSGGWVLRGDGVNPENYFCEPPSSKGWWMGGWGEGIMNNRKEGSVIKLLIKP